MLNKHISSSSSSVGPTHSLNFGITANERSFPHITHKIQMAAITSSGSGISAPSAGLI